MAGGRLRPGGDETMTQSEIEPQTEEYTVESILGGRRSTGT